MSIEPTKEDLLDEVAELDPHQQVRFMAEWFLVRYEDPVHSMPWDEGDYVWLVDECNAADELWAMFGSAVDGALIETAIEEAEKEGWQWVRVADLEAMTAEDEPNFEDLWGDDITDDPLENERLNPAPDRVQ